MAKPAPHLLIFLVVLVSFASLISYRSINSYGAADSFISELMYAPPSLNSKNYAMKSTITMEQDDPAWQDTQKQSKRTVARGKSEKRGKREKAVNQEDAPIPSEEMQALMDQRKIIADEISIRLRDFKPIPPPAEVLKVSEVRKKGIDFGAIATKWELPDGSIDLLEEIHSRTVAFDYNQETDILSLRHPLKTGGTSFSHMLKMMFGQERIIPGSGESTWFNQAKFRSQALNHSQPEDPYWSNMKALYTHTYLRPKGGRKTYFFEDIRAIAPALKEKRFRLMTIIRRPLDLAASSFYETQCRVGRFANQRHLQGGECPPVNLTDVMYKNIEHFSAKCKEDNDVTSSRCVALNEEGGGEKLYGHCGSLDKLFKKGTVHNMMHGSLMGDFPRPPKIRDDEETIGINLTPTLKDVSLYVLRDLGGLIDYNEVHKEDFVFFLVTERFKESLCLFYYRFEVEPVPEKHSLYKPCRPLTFWEEKQKEFHIKNEQFDYTVWSAANAILDVRMEDMRLEIKARLDAGEKLEEIPFLGDGCYPNELQPKLLQPILTQPKPLIGRRKSSRN